ncbi:MAG: alkaline phosphatase D family protein [Panacagrimonas sp.]
MNADDPAQSYRSDWVATNPANAARIALGEEGAGVAGVRWTYWSEVTADPASGEFIRDIDRTVPSRPVAGEASRFSFAFGSCIDSGYVAGNNTTFDSALVDEPAFLAVIGDLSYPDVQATRRPETQTYPFYANTFRGNLAAPAIQRILGNRPLIGIQDDHDYGFLGFGRPRPFAITAYSDTVPGSTGTETSVAYRRWSIGEVDFFLTDTRRYRTEEGTRGGILGKKQYDWLLTGLKESGARVKVIFSPQYFSTRWKQIYEPVLTHIDRHVRGAVLVCSGDLHAAAFNKPRPRVWGMLAGTLGKSHPRHGINYEPRINPALVWSNAPLGGTATENAIGVVDVDTRDPDRVVLGLSWKSEQNRVLYADQMVVAT